jgi:hypothetical protein
MLSTIPQTKHFPIENIFLLYLKQNIFQLKIHQWLVSLKTKQQPKYIYSMIKCTFCKVLLLCGAKKIDFKWRDYSFSSLFILDVATKSQKDHKLFSAPYILCSKKIGN